MKIIRRIILFLAIILSVLWIEAAHADMSGPELREFEVVVIDPEGIDYYNYRGNLQGHLNKGDEVYVMYATTDGYALGRESGPNGIQTIGTVSSLDGFSVVKEEVDPKVETEGITKLDTPKKARIYAEEGVDIYKGPADIYDKVGHINKGTELTYEYTAGEYNYTHIYVEYNGKKAWIEILNGAVLVENDTQYIFVKDVTSECGTVPKNSITTPKYKTDPWTRETLFEYNGCEFMHNSFRDDDIYSIITWDSNIITLKDIELYEYADTTSKVVGTIPAGSEVKILASNEIYYDGERICYIKYNDMIGWAVYTEEIFNYDAPTSEDKPVVLEDTIKIEDIDLPINNQKNGMNPAEIIVLCALGGVLLVLTAVVIIVLVNRSKKLKEEK